MSVWGKQGWDYINTSTDALAGHSIKYGGTLQADLAANNTDKPLGVALEGLTKQAASPWPTLSVETIRGSIVKLICSAGIADAAYTTGSASGTQVTATKLNGTGIVVSAALEWMWSLCLQATTNANEYFTALFAPFECEQ